MGYTITPRIVLVLVFAIFACSKEAPQPTQPTQLSLQGDKGSSASAIAEVDVDPAGKVAAWTVKPSNASDVPRVSNLDTTVVWDKVTLTWDAPSGKTVGEDFENYAIYRKPSSVENNPNEDVDGYWYFGETESEEWIDRSAIVFSKSNKEYSYRVYVNYHAADPDYDSCDSHINEGRVDDWLACLEEQDDPPTVAPSRYRQISEVRVPNPPATPPRNFRITRRGTGWVELSWDVAEGAPGAPHRLERKCVSLLSGEACPALRELFAFTRTYRDSIPQNGGGEYEYTVRSTAHPGMNTDDSFFTGTDWRNERATLTGVNITNPPASRFRISSPQGVTMTASTHYDVDPETAEGQPGAQINIDWNPDRAPKYIAQIRASGYAAADTTISTVTRFANPCGFNRTYQARVGGCQEADCEGTIRWSSWRSAYVGRNPYEGAEQFWKCVDGQPCDPWPGKDNVNCVVNGGCGAPGCDE